VNPERIITKSTGLWYRFVVLVALGLPLVTIGKRAEQPEASFPSLPGAYASSKEHPRVFTTPADFRDLVSRINTAGSFSAQNFARLMNQVKSHLAANVDWDAAYSGCDIDTYLHAFSYEPVGGYAEQMRSASQLIAALNVKPGLSPPVGAAIVAARLALYAALVKAGAKTPPGAPTTDQAAALSKRILMTWASRGFRSQGKKYVSRAEEFCDGKHKFIPLAQSAVGLQIARGVIFTVHAQDLLQSIEALNSKEASNLTSFHAAMFDLIREASNFAFNLPEVANTPYRTCERFSNHFNAHLMGLLSIARLFDDGRKFNAVLYGNDPSISWTFSGRNTLITRPTGITTSRFRATRIRPLTASKARALSRPQPLRLERSRTATDTQIQGRPSAIQPASWQTSSLQGTC
jgi:hypothetical protein